MVPDIIKPPYELDPGNKAVKARKSALRSQLLARRRTIPWDLKDTTRWKVANHLRKVLSEQPGSVVALYWPQGDEIDLRPFAQELRQLGYNVALPRAYYKGHPLAFNLWEEGDELERDEAGIPAATGPEVIPTTIIIPMLGYSKNGYRLGYGGGYYDRTLKALPYPAHTVGVCYTELEVPEFPAERHDIRLATIVTGKEVITCV